MLRRAIRACSPWLVGLIAAMGVTGMLYAYDLCTVRALASLPEIDGCHCWLSGVFGFIAGLACAGLIAIARRLLEPILARIGDAIGRLAAPRGRAPALRDLGLATIYVHCLDPLARRRASRAPPLLL
ncbi:MAG TPA: hypothetical protein VMD07_09755 [Candidatus Acidoferrales bacterium]|nr:hypothetical protein [Candidatus Acidoferrales bacterium]